MSPAANDSQTKGNGMRFWATALIVLLVPHMLQAATLQPGDRVRVSHGAPETVIEGTLVSVDSKELIVSSLGIKNTIPVTTVNRLDRYAGDRRNAGPGLLIGFGVGLVTGLAVVIMTTSDEGQFLDIDTSIIGFFAAAGAAVGTAVGLLTVTEH